MASRLSISSLMSGTAILDRSERTDRLCLRLWSSSPRKEMRSQLNILDISGRDGTRGPQSFIEDKAQFDLPRGEPLSLYMALPPSTANWAPVMYSASSLARKATA